MWSKQYKEKQYKTSVVNEKLSCYKKVFSLIRELKKCFYRTRLPAEREFQM